MVLKRSIVVLATAARSALGFSDLSPNF